MRDDEVLLWWLIATIIICVIACTLGFVNW
jgi:hypothetical protein